MGFHGHVSVTDQRFVEELIAHRGHPSLRQAVVSQRLVRRKGGGGRITTGVQLPANTEPISPVEFGNDAVCLNGLL